MVDYESLKKQVEDKTGISDSKDFFDKYKESKPLQYAAWTVGVGLIGATAILHFPLLLGLGVGAGAKFAKDKYQSRNDSADGSSIDELIRKKRK